MSTLSLVSLGGIGLVSAGFLLWLLIRRYGGVREAVGRSKTLLEVRTSEAQAKDARARKLAQRSYSRDELVAYGLRKAREDSFKGTVPGDQHADVGGIDRGDE